MKTYQTKVEGIGNKQFFKDLSVTMECLTTFTTLDKSPEELKRISFKLYKLITTFG